MTTAPRVTVVIATCNRAALVEQAIASVLAQSYRDFEVIVCDDGSTDDTAVRVARFDLPVRYLALPHSGRPGAPRNRGIEAARGEWVAFLDDDDLWLPDKLARQIELLERRPELGLVYTHRCVRSLDGTLAAAPGKSATQAEDLLDLVLNRQMPFIGTWLVRLELLQRVGGFDEALVTGEDLDLMLRLAPHARVAGVGEALVEVRRQAGSLSEQAGVQAYDNALAVLQRWRRSVTLPREKESLYGALVMHLEARRARTAPWRPSSWAALLRRSLNPSRG